MLFLISQQEQITQEFETDEKTDINIKQWLTDTIICVILIRQERIHKALGTETHIILLQLLKRREWNMSDLRIPTGNAHNWNNNYSDQELIIKKENSNMGAMYKLALNSVYGTTLFGEKLSTEGDYDRPVKVTENFNHKYIVYEVMGIPQSCITVKDEFVNKTKEMFIKIEGSALNLRTDFANEINARIKVDTDIYESYSYEISDGLLTITLKEKKNEVPKFICSNIVNR